MSGHWQTDPPEWVLRDGEHFGWLKRPRCTPEPFETDRYTHDVYICGSEVDVAADDVELWWSEPVEPPEGWKTW